MLWKFTIPPPPPPTFSEILHLYCMHLLGNNILYLCWTFKGNYVCNLALTSTFFLLFQGWREWSDWSSCSAPCSGGTQSRTRSCVTEDCEGRTSNGRYCNSFDCRGMETAVKAIAKELTPTPYCSGVSLPNPSWIGARLSSLIVEFPSLNPLRVV